MIGPGRLILVVGPSGGGKDTIIAGARNACAGNPMVVFPRRVVTRAVSAAEDHDSLDDSAFDRAVATGAFAFWWNAHGLKYGIPRAIDDDIRAGRTVVCNVSRGIIPDARSRYEEAHVVMVTAPADVLAARLAGRSRASDGPLDARLNRNSLFADIRADRVIDNSRDPDDAVGEMMRIIAR